VAESQWRLTLYDDTCVWTLLRVTLLAPRILAWFPGFKKFWTPALDELEQDIRNNYLPSPDHYEHTRNARYVQH